MKRREFISSGARLAAGLSVASALPPGLGAARPAGKPNIVIIMADDLGYGDIGCYGSKAIRTPHIDGMAGEGARLTNFFSSAAVCSPSRAGLLTGRYPMRMGIWAVFFPQGHPLTLINRSLGLPPGLPLDEITLADAIKREGYATACFGKWHLGDMPQYRPHRRGFDEYMGLLYSNDMKPTQVWRNDEIIEESPCNQDTLTIRYTEAALDFIERNAHRPFLLYLPHTFPHSPLHASEMARGRSKAGLYGDCVEEIDWSAGKILSALKERGIDDNTLVFFTSDNGPWFQGNPGPYRGRKSETFDGGMRVPLIARWPGRIPAGRTSDGMAMNFDLFSTSLAAAGAKEPSDRVIDGRNIMPLLQGREDSPHESLFFYHGKELQAVRWREWKYHRRHKIAVYPYVIDHGPWLFNLEDDPTESYNCADKYPEIAAKLDKMLDDWEAEFGKGFIKSGQ